LSLPQKAFGTNADQLFNHFCIYGMKEGRQAISTFNVKKYKSYYDDLQKAFGSNLPLYYKHYIKYGKKKNEKSLKRRLLKWQKLKEWIFHSGKVALILKRLPQMELNSQY